ncbi:unnamed protein product [Amoebophrya sp. A25]|nr:unnamed protein product [Amoebophrya sp. A25]|eukprot:GSA25T00024747001.1
MKHYRLFFRSKGPDSVNWERSSRHLATPFKVRRVLESFRGVFDCAKKIFRTTAVFMFLKSFTRSNHMGKNPCLPILEAENECGGSSRLHVDAVRFIKL